MRVFISGPYTGGDVAANVADAITVGNAIAESGHVPFIPHLFHFWHILYQHEYEFWMDINSDFLCCCQAMLRISGESSGADREEEMAKEMGMPIFYSLDEFMGFVEDLVE